MLQASELILNSDGSIYHLALKPEDIAPSIITVGDPGRVGMVSRYFDHIEVKREKREFVTHTGTFKCKRITVISTGIGTDNIDIVLNELDALVNIDLEKRAIKEHLTPLNIIRVGTSGSLRRELEVDSFVASAYGIGFDNLLHFYQDGNIVEKAMSKALYDHMNWPKENSTPYIVKAHPDLIALFSGTEITSGVTTTNSGFYGPQGRQLRTPIKDPVFNDKLFDFEFEGLRITNLEMETSAIYALSALMGHRAMSLNVILANRASGTFTKNGKAAVDSLIQYTLNKIALSPIF
ncbi:nucleoside phosphorylase [Robertkochia sediminum]|uniref:nucleoside phosphorylase n=1 Tax=Robertkochia sediminum TaxID=2785326 RepID=UPI0019330E38|nr:nucleoside phosphorylase [Robertkochia sediminum]MBL7473521.1 nucleoside phosphorylase [Robertkochia sediminum]